MSNDDGETLKGDGEALTLYMPFPDRVREY